MSLVLRSGQHPRLALLDLPDDVLDMIILFVYSLSSSPGSLDHSTTCIPHTSGFASSCRRIREICLPRLIRHLRFTGGSSLGQDSIEARLRCIAKSKAFAESLLADPHQTAMVRGIRIDQWDVPRGQLPFEHILKEEMREALVVLARLMCSLPNLTEISVFLGYIWEVLHEPLLTVIQGCQTVRGLEVVQGICRTAGDLASLDFLNDVTAPLSELSVFGYRATHEDLEYGGSQASFLVADKPSLLEHLPGHLVKTLKTFIASDLAIYVPPGHSPMVYAAVTALELSCCDVEPGSIFVLFPHLQTLHLDNVVCFEEQYGHLRTAEDAAALEIVKSDPVWPTLQHMRVDLVELLRLGWAFPRTTSLSLHMSMKFGRHDEGAEARHVRELLRATQPTLLSLRADKRYVWYLAKSLRPVDGANVRILSLHAWFGSSQNVRGNSEEVSTMQAFGEVVACFPDLQWLEMRLPHFRANETEPDRASLETRLITECFASCRKLTAIICLRRRDQYRTYCVPQRLIADDGSSDRLWYLESNSATQLDMKGLLKMLQVSPSRFDERLQLTPKGLYRRQTLLA